MRKKSSNIFHGADLTLIFLYCILVFLGWINIYAATVTELNIDLINFETEYGKQLIWIGLSAPIILFIFMFEARWYENYSAIIYTISIILLVGLFAFGKNINGATSWYSFGSFSLQPSEFVKATTALAMAKLVSDSQFNLRKINPQLQAIVLLVIPATLITLQPDPGSAMVYTSFVFVLYREGLPIHHLTFGFTSIILFIATLLFGFEYLFYLLFGLFIVTLIYFQGYRPKALKKGWFKIIGIFLVSILFVFSVEYIFNNVFEQRHRDRFDILLGRKIDTKSIGYNTNQSLTTIASGGLFGKGFLEGERTRGDFVPEQQTDYIFTTVAEQWGFIGTTTVIIIFIVFLLRIIKLAERQKSQFSRVYGYGVTSIFFTHFTVNIGMISGLLPTIGIPLPFFSYGGSSLWGFTALLFIFIRLDANKSYEY